MGRKRSEANEDGDSLLFNAKLAAGAVSSILRDSYLKKSGALPVEESLALSLQGVASVSSSSFCNFPCLIVSNSILSWVLTLCRVSAGGYPYEELGKKGQT